MANRRAVTYVTRVRRLLRRRILKGVQPLLTFESKRVGPNSLARYFRSTFDRTSMCLHHQSRYSRRYGSPLIPLVEPREIVLRKTAAEESACHDHADDPYDGERPILRPEQRWSRAFQEAAAQDDQKISKWIEQCDVLHCLWHICDRCGEAGQNDGRHHKKKHAQQPLLLRKGQGRDHQPDPNRRKQETEQSEVESQNTSSKRDVKPKDGNQDNQRSLDRADQEPRQRFPDKNFC